MTEAKMSAIEKCIRGWESNELTKAEVLERLFELPTLDQQLELLSKLSSDFTDEAKAAVSDLPATIDNLWPGAFVPRSSVGTKERNADLDARSKRLAADQFQRRQELHKYFASLKLGQ